MKLSNIILNEITAYLAGKSGIKPEIGIILGSGLGSLAGEVENSTIIPYSDIPHFPVSTVTGHEGRFVIGQLGGKNVICMQGRFHYYEGYDMKMVTLPIRVMKKLGVSKLIVTNAAGGINEGFKPGDLMIIEDHINLMGHSPLRGKNDDSFGPRFPDMTEAYDSGFREIAASFASKIGLDIKKGVYAGLSGPAFETPAEIRFLKVIGADAVGMSTVPEVLVANHSGMKVLGISCITNMAAGISKNKLDHVEVMETGNAVRAKFADLIKKVIFAI